MSTRIMEPGQIVDHDIVNPLSVQKGTLEEANEETLDGAIWYITDAHTHSYKDRRHYPLTRRFTPFQHNVPGTIEIFAGTEDKIPGGWVICDGRALSRTDYKVLFDIIGVSFGEGNGTNTFNIPDMTTDNRFLIHQDGTYVGENEVQLTVDQLPSHTHEVSYGRSSATGTDPPDSTNYNRTTDRGTSPTGGDEAHENRPPFMKMYYIIKV